MSSGNKELSAGEVIVASAESFRQDKIKKHRRDGSSTPTQRLSTTGTREQPAVPLVSDAARPEKQLRELETAVVGKSQRIEELEKHLELVTTRLQLSEKSRAALWEKTRRQSSSYWIGKLFHEILDAVQRHTPERLRRAVRGIYLPVYRAWYPRGKAPFANQAQPHHLPPEPAEVLSVPGALQHTSRTESRASRIPSLSFESLSSRQPLISVVLPVWNQAGLLSQSIRSVLNQTYSNLELIVVDDGSSDNLTSVLHEYQSDTRMSALRISHQGLPQALNAGFRAAKGEYRTWTSADNLMGPEMLAILLDFLELRPDVDMTYANEDLIDEHGRALLHSNYRVEAQIPDATNVLRLPRRVEPLGLVNDNFIGACFLFRASAGRAVGEYDEGLIGVEDYDFWLRLSQLGVIEHVDSDESLYSYRVHADTLSARRGPEIKRKADNLIAGFSAARKALGQKLAVLVAVGVAEEGVRRTAEEMADTLRDLGHTVTVIHLGAGANPQPRFEEAIQDWITLGAEPCQALALCFSDAAAKLVAASAAAREGRVIPVAWVPAESLSTFSREFSDATSTWILTDDPDAGEILPFPFRNQWLLLLPTNFSERDELPICLKARGSTYPAPEVSSLRGPIFVYLGPMEATVVDWRAISILLESHPGSACLLISTTPTEEFDPVSFLPTGGAAQFLGWKPVTEWPRYLSRASLLLAPFADCVGPSCRFHDTFAAYLASGKPILATPAAEKLGFRDAPNIAIREARDFGVAATALKEGPIDGNLLDLYRDAKSQRETARRLATIARDRLYRPRRAAAWEIGAPSGSAPNGNRVHHSPTARPSPLRCLIETATLHRGGLERVVADQAISLAGRGIEVAIAVTESGGDIALECRAAGIPVFDQVDTSAEFTKVLRERRPDVLLSNLATVGPPAAWREGVPVVTVWHNCFLWFSEEQRETLRRNDLYVTRYIAVSPEVKRQFSIGYGVPSAKIAVIPNGIRPERFEENGHGSRKALTREDLGFDPEDFVMLQVASFYGAKAHVHALSALDKVRRDCPKMRLLLVGYPGDSNYLKIVEQMASRPGLRERVRILPPTDHIEDFYRLADGFQLTSLTEGWSLAKMEAMLFGLPMILTRVGGATEVITDNDVGILVDAPHSALATLTPDRAWAIATDESPQNLEQLTAAARDFYHRREYWRHAGRKSVQKIHAQYRVDEWSSRYAGLLSSVVRQRFGVNHRHGVDNSVRSNAAART